MNWTDGEDETSKKNGAHYDEERGGGDENRGICSRRTATDTDTRRHTKPSSSSRKEKGRGKGRVFFSFVYRILEKGEMQI